MGRYMISIDVGSYELKRSPWMQMEECSARLARSTSDGSADNYDNELGSYEIKWRGIIWVQAVTMWDANGRMFSKPSTLDQRWVGGFLLLLRLLMLLVLIILILLIVIIMISLHSSLLLSLTSSWLILLLLLIISLSLPLLSLLLSSSRYCYYHRHYYYYHYYDHYYH